MKEVSFIFLGFIILSAAIIYHANTQVYVYASIDQQGTIMRANTKTGSIEVCGIAYPEKRNSLCIDYLDIFETTKTSAES